MRREQTAFLLFIALASSLMLSNMAVAAPINYEYYATVADPAMLSKLKTDANAGIAAAQYWYGTLFDPSEPVTSATQKSWANAKYWYLKAAEQGYADAQYNLGVMYDQGQGVPQNEAEAAKWYRNAAKQGVADAQINLGFMYDHGQGVPQNYAEAEKWYTKAAKQGVAVAQYNLGIMYFHGQGVPQNYAEAEKWYTKAAKQGVAVAQYNLGIMYALGYGVPQDYVQAIKWLILAKANGKKGADKILDDTERIAMLQQVAQAQELAKQWWDAHHPASGQ